MDNADTAPTLYNDPAPDRLVQIFGHATGSMVAALPDPVPATPEAFAARNLSAVSQVAALVPVNAIETTFAVQIVVAAAQGLDCQRQAQAAHSADAGHHLHQAAKMMRVSQGAANVLLRLQAARQKREATPESANSAALTEHCALQLMLHALTKLEADKREADRLAAEQAEMDALEAALPPLDPAPITAADIEAAEGFVTSSQTNANRARIIRYRRRMPDWGMFPAPTPAIVNALVFGHSPILDALLPAPA